MASILKYIAQSGMDLFYRDYKSDFQFFALEDFIDNTGNTIAAMYQKYYEQQYKELKSEQKDEIVTFDTGMLSEQVLEVENKDGILVAPIKQPIMTFMYDQNNTGVQIVFNTDTGQQLDRTTATELWQLNYAPKTNLLFYYVDNGSIKIVRRGDCTVRNIRVLYVPQMYAEAVVADTVADDAVQQTILQMRQLMDNQVVKKVLDNNQNLVLEAEMDKAQLK